MRARVSECGSEECAAAEILELSPFLNPSLTGSAVR
jgi:hypothetical protein